MIYHIFEYLKNIGADLPGSGLFQYLSFRAIASFTTALLISILAGKKIIAWLQKKQIGETIRDLGLEGQMQKKGTPTMGGIIIFVSIIIPILLFANLTNIYTILLLISTVWFFMIGFTDDYIKVFKKNKEGLSAKAKLIAQGAMALAIGLAVCFSDQIVVREHVGPVNADAADQEIVVDNNAEAVVDEASQDMIKSTKTTIPFVKSHEFDYGSLSPFDGALGWYTKWAIYVFMIVIVIVACSNGVNLTDGIDGLATGTSAIVGVVLGIIAWLGGNIQDAGFLNIMYIPKSGEIAVFMSAFVGALIGFLWYNAYPAQVFMGDTGSLAIGGIIAVTAIIIHKELLIPIICFVFVMESVSVLLQTNVAKAGNKRGQKWRVFKRAPIHDAFRIKPGQLSPDLKILLKWPQGCWLESKITTRFWIVTIIMAALAIVTLKIR